MLNVHATLTLTGEGSIVFVQPFPIAHAMGQIISPFLAVGQVPPGAPPVTELITARTAALPNTGSATHTAKLQFSPSTCETIQPVLRSYNRPAHQPQTLVLKLTAGLDDIQVPFLCGR